MEYSKENIMTRKEYLKSKKKNKFDFSKLKHFLIIVTIVLLSVYVFKQLNVYNSVTKIANKVVEETALAKTMTMYYVSDSYTKEDISSVMLYRATDESRTKLDGTEGMENIKLVDNLLYGIKDNKLFSIDLSTMIATNVLDVKIKEYVINGNNIYYYTDENAKETGIYRYNINDGKSSKIISGKIYQILVEDSYIFVVAEGKTSQSIIRYNLNGDGKKQLSDKYIVTNIAIYNDKLFFITSKDSKLYMVNKNGGEIKKVTDNAIRTEGLGYSASNSLVEYNNHLYYINKSNNNILHRINLKTLEDVAITKKAVSSIQIDQNVIYYKLLDGIAICKYNITSGKYAQVTSVRTNEYICKN